jgi:V/A-type H+-transporting ATPase subunit I
VSPAAFYLFYLLSISAIVFGVLGGIFFGQEWLEKLGINPLVPALDNPQSMQAICFFIGALHLTLAHGWRFILKMPSLEALADIGWIGVLWAAFFLAKNLILGDSLPYFWKWLAVAGISLVILFTSPQKNIFKGIANGLGTLALSLVNNFTDVVSYIRLFAVGLAGIAIADAFNAMAGMVGFKNIAAMIVSVLILIIGHSLAIALGPVSVLVHGVRLNVLEFSGHANVTWSGFKYKPFKEEGRQNEYVVSAV